MSHLQKRLHLFRYPAFRWYLASCLFATLGGGLQYICLTWLIITKDNSVGAVAIGMLSFFIPSVILGPFIGVIVDRIPYRNYLLAAANWARVISTLLFLGYMHYFNLTLHAIYMLFLVFGVCFSIYLPAMFRLTREMIPKTELLYANATVDMLFEVGNVAGMGLAGVFIAWFSTTGALLVGVIFQTTAAIALMCIRRKHLIIIDDGDIRRFDIIDDFRCGLNYIISKRNILTIYTIQLLLFVQYLTAPVLLSPYAKNVLHATVAQFGLIEMALSVGAVVGGLFMPWIADKIGLTKTVFVAVIICGLSYIGFSHNDLLSIAELIYFILGICFAAWPLVVTQAQEITDIHFQGRVQACFNSISGLVITIIYLAINFGGNSVSIHALYWLESVFALITLSMILINWSQLRSNQNWNPNE